MTTKKETKVSKKTKPAILFFDEIDRDNCKVHQAVSEIVREHNRKTGGPMTTKKETKVSKSTKPARKMKAARLSSNVVKVSASAISKDPITAKTPQALSAFPLTEIMGWRDTCRSRLDARQARLNELHKQHEEIVREADKIDRKQHNDLLWCQKLNRVISRKVFG